LIEAQKSNTAKPKHAIECAAASSHRLSALQSRNEGGSPSLVHTVRASLINSSHLAIKIKIVYY
jgi:hypothetical protein